MIGEGLKGLWKCIRIGFWKRITICSVVVVSVSLFNAFNYPLLRLTAAIGTFVGSGLMLFFYFRLGFHEVRFLLGNKATERPLPEEITTLARSMGLKIEKMKTIPNICNAYVRGGQLFVGEELLRKLNFDQSKATFAHEFGHIKGKHAIVLPLCMLPILTYMCSIWYSLDPMMRFLGLLAYMVLAIVPIQWELERRADRMAIKYVGKEAIKSALLALEERERMDEPSETHPPTSKRLKWIDEAV